MPLSDQWIIYTHTPSIIQGPQVLTNYWAAPQTNRVQLSQSAARPSTNHPPKKNTGYDDEESEIGTCLSRSVLKRISTHVLSSNGKSQTEMMISPAYRVLFDVLGLFYDRNCVPCWCSIRQLVSLRLGRYRVDRSEDPWLIDGKRLTKTTAWKFQKCPPGKKAATKKTN